MIEIGKTIIIKHRVPRLRISEMDYELIFGKILSIEYLGETDIINTIKIERVLNFYGWKEQEETPILATQELHQSNILGTGKILV